MKRLLLALAACSGAAHPHTTAAPAIIDDGGVGAVRLGAPLDGALLGSDAETRYLARFIADGQPLEAFRLAAPPVVAGFAGGGAGAHEAVARAKAGKLTVNMIIIEDAAPRTAAGAGVGSTFAELGAAARLQPVPPTFGGDECTASVPGFTQVWFYFASCDAAQKGAQVVRVMIFDM